MKSKFSTKWKGSSQIRKQRKYRFNAPLHIRQKFMSANLSKDLRKKVGKRNIEVRKGDTVKIMRGAFSGKQGKVNMVDLKRNRISIEGIQRQKKEGTKISVYFHPSKVQIVEMGEGRQANKEKKKEAKVEENKMEKKEIKNKEKENAPKAK